MPNQRNKSKKPVGAYLPTELVEELNLIAEMEGKTITSIIKESIETYIDKKLSQHFYRKTNLWKSH